MSLGDVSKAREQLVHDQKLDPEPPTLFILQYQETLHLFLSYFFSSYHDLLLLFIYCFFSWRALRKELTVKALAPACRKLTCHM